MLNTKWWCARGGCSFRKASRLIDKTDNRSSWRTMCINWPRVSEVEGSGEALRLADPDKGSWEVSIMLVTFQLRLQAWGSVPGNGQSWREHNTFSLGGMAEKSLVYKQKTNYDVAFKSHSEIFILFPEPWEGSEWIKAFFLFQKLG